MKLNKAILDYIDVHYEEAVELLLTLAQIPAPSNNEEKRVTFCRQWLERQGVNGVYVDQANNVIVPIGCTDDNEVTVYMAHSDVVFPDTEPLPLTVDGNIARCPGIVDDTASAVTILMAAKYISEHRPRPQDSGLLLVINSGEEGLGNLRGSKQIVADFGGRIREFVSFDSYPYAVTTNAVGSKRYRVVVKTEGGHSYENFGNKNAIAYLSALINDLYAIPIPPKGKTTYNVGMITGGTSVNTIAQEAEMLYEFRSDERESLAFMEEQFTNIIETYRRKGIDVAVTFMGDRPCTGDVDPIREQALADRTAAAIKRHFDIDAGQNASSTDCNIPLAMGIPAVCTGCVFGGKIHTREEYVELDSLRPGLRLVFDMILHHF